MKEKAKGLSKRKSQTVHFRLSEEEYGLVNELAFANNVSISDFIRLCITLFKLNINSGKVEICKNKIRHIRNICFEVEKVKNFNTALNSLFNNWELHHIKETKEGMKVNELKDLGLYFNRPANEFVFLPKDIHKKIHSTCFSAEEKLLILKPYE